MDNSFKFDEFMNQNIPLNIQKTDLIQKETLKNSKTNPDVFKDNISKTNIFKTNFKNFLVKDDFVVLHNSLYIISAKTLILSDLHLGYDESIKNEGVLIPLISSKKFLIYLKSVIKIIEKNGFELNNIIFNGDVKHEFSKVLRSEDKIFKELLKLSADFKLLFIKGNHDALLDSYFLRSDIAKPLLSNSVFLSRKIIIRSKKNNYIVVHGDDDKNFYLNLKEYLIIDNGFVSINDSFVKKNDNLIESNYTFIIGHEHPVIVLSDNFRNEQYKTILFSKKLIILPSFNPMIEGTNFNYAFKTRSFLSPILNQFNIKDFEVFLFHDNIDSEIFYFGSLLKILN